MTQNPFQPWKQNFNLPNQFYRKSDNDLSTFTKVKNGDAGASSGSLNALSHQYELSNDSTSYQAPVTSSNSGVPLTDSDQPTTNKSSTGGAKFSIFSQLLNLNKINAFDNLLLNASVSLDDEELSNDKRQGIRKLMEQAISDEAKQQIAFILEKISSLRPAEKLLLYLKMPGGHSEVDPLKQSQNPLGSRSEISHTINWVRSHLEHDEKVSIPKQEVYEDYVSFCGKINIKPLSTADFGKVMKQVFPDIRPRRLGTRGHSRYCYAAMRKATKLQPPHLPDITSVDDLVSKNSEKDENSWKVIKSWSEGLLNAQFECFDDLAIHISENKLSSPSASTSKQLLQKKIMQREIKDRRRNNNQALKKRRKKRQNSSGSLDTGHDLFDENIKIKQEKETDGSAIENNYSEDSSDVPMNLTSSEQSRRVENELNSSTNHSSVPTQFDCETSDSVKNKLKQKINSTSESIDLQSLNQDDNQYVLCKKVRQAQQLKMTANSALTMMSNQYQDNSQANANVSSSEVVHEMVMPSKIPKRKQRKDVNGQSKKSKYPDRADAPEQQTTSPLNQVEPNDLVVKNGDLKEDFILPRERFISICNMDRNALDTYLNANEENSQDLELLQYFGEDKNKSADCVEVDLGPAPTNVPLLENYQLLNEGRNNIDKNSDKISQLRSMLEEKYNSSSVGTSGGDSVIKNLLQKNFQQAPLELNNCEQMNHYANVSSAYGNIPQRHGQIHNLPRGFQADSSNGNDKFIPQSPNTRRKNFSFVPIPSQTTRAKNINLHPAFKGDIPSSPFVSPRATPVNRRANSFLNIRNPNMSIDSKSVPVIGANNTAFCRPHQFKLEPASAPQSPSMIQSYNYSPQAQHTQQNQFQFQSLNNQGTNYNYPVESRSQSVPPHCTNTNMFNNYNSYSSACSSMAPTPVPSDYQEFSDSSILDIFNNEQAPPSSTIKMEANDDDDVIDLLDNEILSQNENQSNRQSSFANSRSVPNTPLPYHVNYNTMNSFCPVGKSVPTTPLGNNGNPFRYSPDMQRTRDFLINGFNNNNINVINNNTNKMTKDDDGSLSNDIDDLSNLDTSLLNNL